MSDETTTPPASGPAGEIPLGQQSQATDADDCGPAVDVKTPEFVPLHDAGAGEGAPIDRFYDVDVTIWAELGRVTLSLGELMRLGPNAVVKLGRPVSAPVELMAQGVRFATGEVVVVDDCFAVRIQEIEPTRQS